MVRVFEQLRMVEVAVRTEAEHIRRLVYDEIRSEFARRGFTFEERDPKRGEQPFRIIKNSVFGHKEIWWNTDAPADVRRDVLNTVADRVKKNWEDSRGSLYPSWVKKRFLAWIDGYRGLWRW